MYSVQIFEIDVLAGFFPDKGDMYAVCTFFFFFLHLSFIEIILIFPFKCSRTSENIDK